MRSLLVENLSKNKGAKSILKDINLSIEANKIYGIIGSNGAGKTTLFKALLGLINYSGTITIDDCVLKYDNSKEYFKKTGLVMPFPDYYNKLSIREVFEEHLFYMNYKLEKEITTVLEEVGLKTSLETIIEELSLGMKQKLNIALALSHNPEILILDEPFNGLDRKGIILLKSIIKRFKEHDKVVLISSHSFSELDDIIDEVIVLDNGEVIATDSIPVLREKAINSLEEYYSLLWKGDRDAAK